MPHLQHGDKVRVRLLSGTMLQGTYVAQLGEPETNVSLLDVAGKVVRVATSACVRVGVALALLLGTLAVASTNKPPANKLEAAVQSGKSVAKAHEHPNVYGSPGLGRDKHVKPLPPGQEKKPK